MRRTSNLLALLLAGLALAQDQRPLPRGAPPDFVPTAPRVHVRASEELDPDRLRELARPGVTLWLSTRSNTLRDSTLENVARFDVAWVRLRAPLRPVDARVFAKLPHAGAWVTVATPCEGRCPELELAALLPGARRLAVELSGALDERFVERLARARPAELGWTPPAELELLTWGLLRSLPGRRVIHASPQVLLPVRCAERRAGDPTLELHVASLLSLSSDVFPCGVGTRVIVEPNAEPWLLQSLLVRDPSVELVIDVGADPARALAARALLDRLQLGPSR
ncbi:MAG: hypothetical protein ACOZQL_30150 [Myxococcota bacterium]